jgi:hypothetical protein
MFELVSWFLEGEESIEAVATALNARNIKFYFIDQSISFQKQILTQGGVILAFELSDDEIYKLASISLSRRAEMEAFEPSKQISITIPLREYEKIRREAEKQRLKMGKICSQWVVERANDLE